MKPTVKASAVALDVFSRTCPPAFGEISPYPARTSVGSGTCQMLHVVGAAAVVRLTAGGLWGWW